MTLKPLILRLIAALLAIPILALALYKRIGTIVSFQKSELARGARFATTRVATAGASVLLLVVIGIVAAAGAPMTVVYALLFIGGACVLVYLALTAAAGFVEGKARHDHEDRG